jgi:hypothetical protein
VAVRIATVERSRRAALGLLLLADAGCTRLLGIDGEYAQSRESDSGPAAVRVGTGGAFGVDGAGGESGLGGQDAGSATTSASTGGWSAGGGSAGEASAQGGEAGTGGTATSIPPPQGPCVPGAYQGPESGHHAPTITVLGVKLDVTGTVKFRLANANAGTSAIMNGVAEGTLQIIGTPPFTATLTGRVECETGRFVGVIDGKFWLTSNVSAVPASTFHGTYDGTFSTGQFSGTWNEEEPNAPITAPGAVQTGKGSGIWSATRTGS